MSDAKGSYHGTSISAGGDVNLQTIAGRDVIVNHGPRSDELTEIRLIADWLTAHNHKALQKDMFARAAPQTGHWFIESQKFKEWIAGSSLVLWGTGIPAAGKTVLSSIVINHIENCIAIKDTALVYTFCRYTDQLSVLDILSILLKQLAENSESVLRHLKMGLYARCLRDKTLPSKEEIKSALLESFGFFSRVFIVVDGLDELEEEVRFGITGILATFRHSIFTTSRPLDLSNGWVPNVRLAAPASDFEIFIQQEIRRLPKLNGLLKKRPDVQKEIAEKIEKTSDGMFLLAALQISTLKTVATVNSLRAAVDRLPVTLDDMYHVTLSRIQRLAEEEREIAYRAILWVTHSFRTLGIEELLAALPIDSETTELDPDDLIDSGTLMSLCQGLLTIDEEAQTVRLIHYTTQSFFSSRSIGSFDNPHGFLATACAVYLTHCPISVGYAITPPDPSENHFSSTLLDYTSFHLGSHIKEAFKRSGTLPARVTEYFNSLTPASNSVILVRPDLPSTDYGDPIHLAAMNGIRPLLGSLTWRDQCLNTSKVGYTPLMYACMRGHVAFIVEILSLGPEKSGLNELFEYGSALTIACSHKHVDVIKLLVNTPGIDVISESIFLYLSPLRVAFDSGDAAIVNIILGSSEIKPVFALYALLRAAESPHKTDIQHMDQQPGILSSLDLTLQQIWDAVHLGPIAVANLLVACEGVDFNAQNLALKTALHLAAEMEHRLVLDALLHLRVNVDATDALGRTAMHYAALYGHEKVVQTLLEHHANPNIQDSEGKTPLHLAAADPYLGMRTLDTLLKNYDINPQIPDYSGMTPFELAVKTGNILAFLLSSKVVEIPRDWKPQSFCEKLALNLQSPGFDPDQAIGPFGMTPLMQVIVSQEPGYTVTVKHLLDVRKVDVNAVDDFGDTALFYAARTGSGLVTGYLLQTEGIDVNKRSHSGMSALLLAITCNRVEISSLLLNSKQVDINARGPDDATPLIRAAYMNNWAIARHLLHKEGVDANAVQTCPTTSINYHGDRRRTALIAAVVMGNSWIVELLIGHEGIDLNVRGDKGRTALMIAAMKKNTHIYQLLEAAKGIDLSARDDDGLTAQDSMQEAVDEAHSRPSRDECKVQ